MAPVKDGVIRRGSTWSYVIRVSNPVTGTSRPKWSAARHRVGGQGGPRPCAGRGSSGSTSTRTGSR